MKDLFAPPTKEELTGGDLFAPPTREELGSPKESMAETGVMQTLQGAAGGFLDEAAGAVEAGGVGRFMN